MLGTVTSLVLPIATIKSKKDSSPARCPGDPSCTCKLTHHQTEFVFPVADSSQLKKKKNGYPQNVISFSTSTGNL